MGHAIRWVSGMTEQATTRRAILEAAADVVCRDRQATHGNPESTFGRIAEYWSVYLHREVTAFDVAEMMQLFKTARIDGNPTHLDSHVDRIGYAACSAEIATGQGGGIERIVLDDPLGLDEPASVAALHCRQCNAPQAEWADCNRYKCCPHLDPVDRSGLEE